MTKVNEITNAVNDSSIVDEQEPIIMDVFHVEETIWYVTYRSDGEERGTRQILANDIYNVIAKALSIVPKKGIHTYKVNIYSLDIDFLQVPYDEPALIYTKGNTDFVETRDVKTNSEMVGTEVHVEITVFDVGSKEQGKAKKFVWEPLFG